MRRKSKLFGMLVRNYIFFSLTVGLTVFLLLVWFIVQTNQEISYSRPSCEGMRREKAMAVRVLG